MTNELLKHEATFSDFKAITYWTDDKDEAKQVLNQLKSEGAKFSHIFTDSCIGKYRVVGHFERK